MAHRRTILTGVAIVVVMMLATALVIRRGDAEQPSGVRTLAGRQSASAFGLLVPSGVKESSRLRMTRRWQRLLERAVRHPDRIEHRLLRDHSER